MATESAYLDDEGELRYKLLGARDWPASFRRMLEESEQPPIGSFPDETGRFCLGNPVL